MASAAFQTQMARLQDAHPKTKVEFISPTGVVTDISAYYFAGANFQQTKDRAVDEVQAGNFTIELTNQDNLFSEYVATSLFYNQQYHLARIRVSEGFVLLDGTEEYVVQGLGFIDNLTMDANSSHCVLSCRDLIRAILDQQLHATPTGETPVLNAANIGNGVCSAVETLPFTTKNETWTLTCTLGGTNGVAQFSVVGTVSGSIGPLTSGTQFTTGAGAGGVKFTVNSGTTNWSVGDVITFSTKQYPEFTSMNIIKIIWNVLTGYDWDTNTQSNWSGLVLSFDHTQSTANTDLDYASFVQAISDTTGVNVFNLTGACPYNTAAVDFIRGLMMLFLGSIYTGNDGRLTIKTFIPQFVPTTLVGFSDSLKIVNLGYTRTIDEVVNYVAVQYKATKTFVFSDIADVFDGEYVSSYPSSITKYGPIAAGYQVPWYSISGQHAKDFADKLVQKYAEPPLNLQFDTGVDALLSAIGDNVAVTDTKFGLAAVGGQISQITRNFDTNPVKVNLRVRRDADLGLSWTFLGSEANEGDGISPQSDNWLTASTTDLQFGYLSNNASAGPDYRMF